MKAKTTMADPLIFFRGFHGQLLLLSIAVPLSSPDKVDQIVTARAYGDDDDSEPMPKPGLESVHDAGIIAASGTNCRTSSRRPSTAWIIDGSGYVCVVPEEKEDLIELVRRTMQAFGMSADPIDTSRVSLRLNVPNRLALTIAQKLIGHGYKITVLSDAVTIGPSSSSALDIEEFISELEVRLKDVMADDPSGRRLLAATAPGHRLPEIEPSAVVSYPPGARDLQPVGSTEEHDATGYRDGKNGMPPRSNHPAYLEGHHRGLAEHEGAKPSEEPLTIDKAKETGKADALADLQPRSRHPLYVEGYEEGRLLKASAQTPKP